MVSVRKRSPGHTCSCAHAQVDEDDALPRSGATQQAVAQSLHVHALAISHAHAVGTSELTFTLAEVGLNLIKVARGSCDGQRIFGQLLLHLI